MLYDFMPSSSGMSLLRLRFPILVIKYVLKVDDRVGATELTVKHKPDTIEM